LSVSEFAVKCFCHGLHGFIWMNQCHKGPCPSVLSVANNFSDNLQLSLSFGTNLEYVFDTMGRVWYHLKMPLVCKQDVKMEKPMLNRR